MSTHPFLSRDNEAYYSLILLGSYDIKDVSQRVFDKYTRANDKGWVIVSILNVTLDERNDMEMNTCVKVTETQFWLASCSWIAC